MNIAYKLFQVYCSLEDEDGNSRENYSLILMDDESGIIQLDDVATF